MKLLHIACIGSNPCSGISVAVPQHLLHQSKLADVAFLNINNCMLNDFDCQLTFSKPFKFVNLPHDFQHPDLVVFHGCFFKNYISIYKELKRNNIPYIIIPHGSLTIDALSKKWLKKKLFRLLFLNRFVRDAVAIQYLSQGELAKSAFKHVNSFVGPNGVDEKEEIALPQSNIVFTYIGRLDVYYKGLDLLCEACNLEKEYLERNRIVVNLYGPEANEASCHVEQLIERWNVHNIIKVHGSVFAEEKKNILLRSSVFIQTSRSEGIPMGILEALSFGIPCVVTKGTNLAEIINKYNAGWTCKTSAQEIATILRIVVEEINQVKNKGINAKNLIHENYSWDIISQKTIEQYKLIISQIQ